MSNSVSIGLAPTEPTGSGDSALPPLPELGPLIESGQWKRAAAVASLSQTDPEVQAALSDVLAIQEAIRARRYTVARKALARYQAASQTASPATDPKSLSELELLKQTLNQTLNPTQLEQALLALEDRKETEPSQLTEQLAPALAHLLTRAEALNSTAVLHIYREEPLLAGPLLQEALVADAGHYRALMNTGNLQLEAGNAVEAERIYREVLKLNPDYDSGHHNLGVALRKQGKLGQSVKEIRKGQKLGVKRTQQEAAQEAREQMSQNPIFRKLRWVALVVAAVLVFMWLRSLGN